MAFRDFIARHRLGPAIAAPAALGVAAIAAATFALTTAPQTVDTQLTSSVTECHDMVTISVAGRNDTPRQGTTKLLLDANGKELPAALSDDYHSEWVDPVVNAPKDDVEPGSYAAVYIAYPANLANYEDAVNAGVANTKQVMHDIAAACPDTKFSIVGYSEGSDVVRRVAQDIGHEEPGTVDPDQVVGVVILADPGRSAGDGPFPGAQNPSSNPDGFDRPYQNGGSPTPGQGALPGTSGGFGKLDGKVASFCSDGDLTCAAPQNISLLQLAVNVGRQVNIDNLERDGLTPATGQDVAVALGKVAFNAFDYIGRNPQWWTSDETFLQVLLKVSDPQYVPGKETPPAPADSISSEAMTPLAYLPQKVFNEIVGLIVTNQNTIPVVLSDPYQQTFGPNHVGHHFDYWKDADPANGKPLTTAEYAAAWLTHLAKQAQAGEQIDTATKPTEADVAAVRAAAASTAASTSSAPTSTSGTSTPRSSESATSSSATTTAPTTTPAETTTESKQTTTTAPTTTPSETATSELKARTTTPAPASTTTSSAPATTSTTTPAPR